MAEKKIAHATPELLAINTAPDNCIVGTQVIPFDITCMLSTAINPSGNVNALSTPVILLNTQLATVAGDAGAGVKSGTCCGKVEILDASTTVYANGQQVPFHDSLCTMNNGNTVGKVCTAKSSGGQAEGDAEGTGSAAGPEGVSGTGGDGGSAFATQDQEGLMQKVHTENSLLSQASTVPSPLNRDKNMLSAVGGVLKKIWALPNTLIGLAYGGVGMMFGAKPVWDGSEGILRFVDMPKFMMGSAMSLGHVQVYGKGYYQNPDGSPALNRFGVPVTVEETLHTRQAEILGPLYFPLHILSMSASLLTGGGTHDNNLLEKGPERNRGPWPWN